MITVAPSASGALPRSLLRGAVGLVFLLASVALALEPTTAPVAIDVEHADITPKDGSAPLLVIDGVWLSRAASIASAQEMANLRDQVKVFTSNPPIDWLSALVPFGIGVAVGIILTFAVAHSAGAF